MPLPLAPLDRALIARPKTVVARAVCSRVLRALGRQLALQARVAAAVIVALVAYLLYWPTVFLVVGMIVAGLVFAANGMWRDVSFCALYTPVVFGLYLGLARLNLRLGGGGRTNGTPHDRF